MTTVILDCYTDEPSGLGVPPYLGTYPRYLAGFLKEQGEDPIYLTIDDLRWLQSGKPKDNPKPSQKTNIFIYNRTNNNADIIKKAHKIYIILGVHVPGKYLTAMPGTLNEVSKLLKGIKGEKILTGPVFFGTSLQGGKKAEKIPELFNKIEELNFSFEEAKKYAIKGADIFKQIPDPRMIEIETGRGCPRKCSFCTEPIKSIVQFRDNKDIVEEIKTFYNLGARFFRLGKQSDFYLTKNAPELLENIRKECPDIKVLHIDNVNPQMVLGAKGKAVTEAIVKHCTSGNIAAFGVESFDPDVVKQNNLVTTPEQTYQAIKIINELGAERGPSGMPKFLPGINILFGLRGETKESNEHNLKWLKKILDEDLLIRRINIRQVNLYPGTSLHDEGGAMIKKNKKHYFKWRKQIREEIDYPMLKNLLPKGTILNDVYTEMYDGNTTFCRQFGTYPIIIGIKGRLPLKQFIKAKITGHQLRSVEGELVE